MAKFFLLYIFMEMNLLKSHFPKDAVVDSELILLCVNKLMSDVNTSVWETSACKAKG